MTVEQIGKYKVVRRLGRGGMAEVYEARDPILDRPVAIKLILPGLGAEAGFADRFRREAKVVAGLRHTHIVQLFDFDFSGEQPFMVMEYLDGGTLKDRLDQHRAHGMPMPLLERYFKAVASALDYAHERDAIHRDIKPTNILFTAGGDPVVADFGLAKILGSSTQISRTGTVMGTPSYMSPEQVLGSASDSRTDIYALGILLYEMATGRVPFQAASPTEVMDQQVTQPPPEPRMFNPSLGSELQAVIIKALAKDPEDRYPTAGDFSAALHDALQFSEMGTEILDQPTVLDEEASLAPPETVEPPIDLETTAAEPIEAERQVTPEEKLEPTEAPPAVEEILPAAPTPTSPPQTEVEAPQAVEPEESVQLGAESEVPELPPAPATTPTPPTEIVEGIELESPATPETMAAEPDAEGAAPAVEQPAPPADAPSGPATLIPGTEVRPAHPPPATKPTTEAAPPAARPPRERAGVAPPRDLRAEAPAVAPPGRRWIVWAAGAGGALLALVALVWGGWTLLSGLIGPGVDPTAAPTQPPATVASPAAVTEPATLAPPTIEAAVPITAANAGQLEQVLRLGRGTTTDLAFSPDSGRLAVSGSLGIWIYDLQTEEPLRLLEGHTDWVRGIAWSADGARLASGSDDATVRIWDAASGTEIAQLRGHSQRVRSVAWSPSGDQLISGGNDGTLLLWDVGSGSQLASQPGGSNVIWRVAWSPVADLVAWSGTGGVLRVWDLSGAPRILSGHSGDVWDLAWSPDGSRLVSAGGDGTVRVWDPASGAPLGVWQGHTGAVQTVAYSPEGDEVISGGADQTLRVWAADSGESTAVLEGPISPVNSASWSPSGQLVASSSDDGAIRVWDPSSWEPRSTILGHLDWVNALAWSPDGSQVAGAIKDGVVRLWSVELGGTEAGLEGLPGSALSVAWSQDGGWIAAGGEGGVVQVWVADGARAAQFSGLGAATGAISWRPTADPAAVAMADAAGWRLWPAPFDTEPGLIPAGFATVITSMAWSPAGNQLALGGDDGSVWLQSSEGGEPVSLQGHADRVTAVAWSPDGGLLASASMDGTVRLWNPDEAAVRGVLEAHPSGVLAVGWSPDGGLLATSGPDGLVRVWSAGGELLASLQVHRSQAQAIGWAPDGARLAVGSRDGVIHIWGIVQP